MAKKELITTGIIVLVLVVLIALTWSTILSIFLTIMLISTVLMRLWQHFLIDREDSIFLDDENSFPEGTAAMMLAATIYRGVNEEWLDAKYLKYADQIRRTMETYVDDYGIIHEVCGCPDFVKPGTSAESMAAYLMMHAHWRTSRSTWRRDDPDLDCVIDMDED